GVPTGLWSRSANGALTLSLFWEDRLAMSDRLIVTGEGTGAGGCEAGDWALLAVTALMWGSAYLFIEIGLRGLEPTAIAFVRVALGAGLLIALPPARSGRIEGRDRARVALLGLLWMAVPLTLYPIAQQWVTSAEAGM